jgi:hypothetical protein
MSRGLITICLGTALLLAALAAPSSSFGYWTTNGTPSGTIPFTTAAGSSAITVVATGAPLQTVSCSTANASNTIHNSDITRPDGTKIKTQHIGKAAGCQISGMGAAVNCEPSVLSFGDGIAYSPSTNVATLQISGVECQITTAFGCGNSTTVTGGITVAGSYLETYGNTSQQFAVQPSGQSLSATWSGGGCLAGSSPGTAKWTNTSGTALAYSVTSTFKPQISN